MNRSDIKSRPETWKTLPEGIYPISFIGIIYGIYNEINPTEYDIYNKINPPEYAKTTKEVVINNIRFPDDKDWVESPAYLNKFCNNDRGVYIGDICRKELDMSVNHSIYLVELKLSNNLIWETKKGWSTIRFEDFIKEREMII